MRKTVYFVAHAFAQEPMLRDWHHIQHIDAIYCAKYLLIKFWICHLWDETCA